MSKQAQTDHESAFPAATSELGDVYDRAFFSEYGTAEPRYAEACRFIGAELAARFTPKSVVDFGCGAGLHLGALVRAGAAGLGVDAVTVDNDLRDPDATVVYGDLRNRAPLEHVPAQYSLGLCIDVLEHLEERHADAALAHLVRGAEMVVLSCAPPHQGGHYHINEQPRRYWIDRMATHGWSYVRSETGSMENHFRTHREVLPHSWMYHNLCVYRRSNGLQNWP